MTDPNNAELVFEDVDYLVAAQIDLPAGDYVFGLDVDNDAVPDLSFGAGLTGFEGAYLNVYATNDGNDPAGVALAAQLDTGDVLVIDPL